MPLIHTYVQCVENQVDMEDYGTVDEFFILGPLSVWWMEFPREMYL
jgi:hypothetical protein